MNVIVDSEKENQNFVSNKVKDKKKIMDSSSRFMVTNTSVLFSV